MSVQERRDKLIEQVQMFLQDEHKMDEFEAKFKRMLNSEESLMNENQKKEVLEVRDQVASGEMETTPWNEVRAKLDLKYGI